MALCIIELNDSEIRVARDTKIVLSSPGYALIREQGLELGMAAARLARLHPQASNNRYWNNLSQDPLQHSSPRARHHADLAYAQLLALHKEIGQPAEILFAVPGSYSREQLALLLGMVEACPFQALGLVDSAVAASAQSVDRAGVYVHLDIHLHHSILTELQVADDVSKTGVQTLDDVGLASIYDACAARIADLFIRQARFDPQHHAETEQALYDQLPQCLQRLSTHADTVLEIAYQGGQHQARVARAALFETLADYYRKIIEAVPEHANCLLSDRLARLPGLVQQGQQRAQMRVLDPASIFKTCRAQLALVRSSGPALKLVTRLPVIADSASRETTDNRAAASALQATHILAAAKARPLSAQPLFLAVDNAEDELQQGPCSVFIEDGQAILQADDPSGVFVNGKPPQRRSKMQAGDLLSFANGRMEYRLIHVADAGSGKSDG